MRRASACGASAPSRSCWRPAPSSGRWSSPTTTGPASCWPRPPPPMPDATARCPAGAPCCSPTTTAPIAPRSIWPTAGATVAAVVDLRPEADRELTRAGAPARHRAAARPRHRRHHGRAARRRRHGHAARRESGVGGTTRALSCDLVLTSGGWTPAVHLFTQSRGKLRLDESIAAFVPGHRRPGRTLRRRLPRQLLAGGLHRRGPCRRCGGRGRCRLRQRPRRRRAARVTGGGSIGRAAAPDVARALDHARRP